MGKRQLTYTEFLDAAPTSRFLWLLVAGVAAAQILDGYDYQITSFALPGIIKDLHLNPAQAGAIAAATNLGLLLGAVVFSVLSDRLGRRPIFMVVLGVYAFGTFLSAVAPDYQTLLMARAVAGFGVGSEFPIAFALLAEYSPARLRHLLIPSGPFCYGVGWVLAGALSVPLVPAFGWRALYWVGVVPALLVVYVRRFIPESVRFLLAHGRRSEAARVIGRVLAASGQQEEVELVPPAVASGADLELRRRLGLLRPSSGPLVALALLYFCQFIQTFAINSWLPTIFVRQGFTLVRSFDYSLIILVATPLSMVIAAWLQERVDRRFAMVALTLLGSGFFVLFGLSFEFRLPVTVTVAAQFLQSLFGSGVVAVLYTLGTELFATEVRSLGMGIVTAFGRIGAIAGPYVLGLFLTFGTAIHQIIYLFTIPLVAASLITVFLVRVDPRRRPLEAVLEQMGAAPPT